MTATLETAIAPVVAEGANPSSVAAIIAAKIGTPTPAAKKPRAPRAKKGDTVNTNGALLVTPTEVVTATPAPTGVATKGQFSLRPGSVIDADKARRNLDEVFRLIDEGKPRNEIRKTEAHKALTGLARKIGYVEAQKAVSEAERMAHLRDEYADQIEDSREEFRRIVNTKAQEAKASKNGGEFALTMTLRPGDATPTIEEHDTDGSAATEFMNLKKAAQSGRLTVCGIMFAVVYKDGFSKVVTL